MSRTTAKGARDPRRALPSVAVVLEWPEVGAWLDTHPRPLVVAAVQSTLSACRAALGAGDPPPDRAALLEGVGEALEREEFDRCRPVINATGVLLHTGLGRAVLPPAAARALADADRGCNLQIDLATGLRGKRNARAEQLLCRLTGAEAALVVNNNAGATLLMLAALCPDREVVVSRGQLIEIGGSYRLPDCVHQSGARLVEVGTTNKTHLRDYAAALGERTGAILRVNPSNYRIIGFAQSVSVADLVSLKREREVLVLDDLGCGALVDLRRFGLPQEPTAPESIAAGADLCCFSGDKLIGGPQAGIIVGRKALVDRIRKHPLTRMLRVGKLTEIALEATLRLFLEPDRLPERHPLYAMLTATPAALRRRAAALVRRIGREAPGLRAEVVPCASTVGGGSLPGYDLPGYAVALRRKGTSADTLAARLRCAAPPVVARIEADAVLLDVRTVLPGEERALAEAVGGLG